jgi:predicted TPR repeat methyltransferase
VDATAEAYSELAGVYDEMVVDPSYPGWADFCERLWQLDSRGVHSVLDVCCGTGLFAAELSHRGYHPVGVDGSAAMLARARYTLGPDAELHHALLPELGTTGVFDAAVSTFDGLNYVPAEVFAASIAAVVSRLRPGGWFIFDLHTDALMHFTAATPVVSGTAEGRDFTLTSEVDSQARTCRTTIELTAADGTCFREQHVQFFHSDSVIRKALADAGFSSVAVFEEYTDRPVTETTLRATWVARQT